MTSWADIQATWTPGWRSLAARASAVWDQLVRADPDEAVRRVKVFVEAIGASRAALDRIVARLAGMPPADPAVLRHRALEARWAALAAGFFAHTWPAEGVGAAPAVLLIGGLAVGAAGVAWAAVAWQYAVNLREQTALAAQELEARVQAAREGRTLGPSTVPSASPSPSMRGWVLAGLAVITGALVLPVLLKR
jgi:hypothetical protein